MSFPKFPWTSPLALISFETLLVFVALVLTGAAGCRGAGGDCTFAVTTNAVSPQIPTVGVVEWSLAGEATPSQQPRSPFEGTIHSFVVTGSGPDD